MPHQPKEERATRPGLTGTGPSFRLRAGSFRPLSLIVFILVLLAGCEFKTEVRAERLPAVVKPSQAEAQAPQAPPVADPGRAREEAGLSPAQARARDLTDAARFFAGLGVDGTSEFSGLAGTDIWKCNAARMDSLWTGFPKVQARMAAWAGRELAPVFDPTAPVYYPFSGPDIVFPLIFFPCAQEYILVGLEPVGDVLRRQGLTVPRLDELLSSCAVAVQDLVRLSFYRTKVMEPEFAETALKGVLPVLMVSLARLDMDILEVEPGTVDENGGFIQADPASPERRSVVRITFRKAGETRVQSLTYFSCDLSNGGLKKTPGFSAYLANTGRYFTFIKSASYLCRKTYFSRTRKAILDRSYAVLQDDSGLAFASFSPEAWKISLYGTYEKPVRLFEDSYEPDLYDAVQKSAKPLNFRFGYSPASCLTLAVKKTS